MIDGLDDFLLKFKVIDPMVNSQQAGKRGNDGIPGGAPKRQKQLNVQTFRVMEASGNSEKFYCY